MNTPPNTGLNGVVRPDRYRIAIVNLDTHDRFDLVDTETNRTVRIYRSLTQARIDCRFLNAHDTVLSQLARQVRARQLELDSDFSLTEVLEIPELPGPPVTEPGMP